jgi:hypothetical protein
MTSHSIAFKTGFKRGTFKIKIHAMKTNSLRFLKKMRGAAVLDRDREILRMND